MRKGVLLLLLCGLVLCVRPIVAQTNPCISPFSFTNSKKVACTLTQVYGPFGIVEDPDLGPVKYPPNDIPGIFLPRQDFLHVVSSDVASQIALLPFVTPSSGIAFTFDKSLRVFTVSEDSFGPIFSERSSTVGRGRLALGFSYQHIDFDSLDGINLHNFPTVYLQRDQGACTVVGAWSPACPGGALASTIRDYITATNDINLTINQYTSFVTIGVSNRIDISAAIPVLQIRLGATANANAVDNSGNNIQFGGCVQIGSCVINGDLFGEHHIFSNSNRSSGLGDLTLRIKGSLFRWEHAGLAAGLDVRVPTGNEMNFLGTGAYGVKPFVVWSYGGRISPHVNLGYEWNGRSVLAADITTGTKANLPGEFLYSAGVEAALTKRLTATMDLLGERVINGTVVQLSQINVPGHCDPATSTTPFCQTTTPDFAVQTTISANSGSYGTNNAALGLRLRPFGKLLLTGSVQLKLDNGGLRSKAIPMVSATYTFR